MQTAKDSQAGRTVSIEIRETANEGAWANFHVYLDGYYHCSCVTREEAEAIVRARFS